MDCYAEALLSRGASLVTIGKGRRTALWTDAARRHGGFYLTAVGGAAALAAERHVASVRVIDYPDLGMEAVRLVELRGLPAFLFDQ
jgi:fumarate hydratase class I